MEHVLRDTADPTAQGKRVAVALAAGAEDDATAVAVDVVGWGVSLEQEGGAVP